MAGGKSTEKGFTLVETLIALAILVIGAIAFIPLFVLSVERVEEYNRRTVAATLANGALEEMRAADFKDIVVTDSGSSPAFPKEEDRTVNGVTYKIERSVAWISESGDCVDDDGKNPLWDAKLVQVTVSADSPNRKRKITESVETIISRQVFQEPSPGSGIRVCAFHGWQEDPEIRKPVQGVKVNIKKTGSSGGGLWTSSNNRGAALFFLETSSQLGTYTVTFEAPINMLIRPDQTKSRTVTVSSGNWAKEVVYAEYPSWLEISLRDADNKPIKLTDAVDSHLAIRFPVTWQIEPVNIPISSGVVRNIELWPLGSGSPGEYDISVRGIPGYHDAEGRERFVVPGDEIFWNGTFPGPKSRLSLIVYLDPVPSPPADAARASGLEWLNGCVINPNPQPGNYEAQDENNNLLSVVWENPQVHNPLVLENGTPLYIAKEMYWGGNLVINGGLNLEAELQVFNGWVNTKGNSVLTLSVPEGFGIPSTNINDGDETVTYGIVHFVRGLFVGDQTGDDEFLLKGIYYYPDGAKLPEDKDKLIRWYPLD